jgi:hypothetical protein
VKTVAQTSQFKQDLKRVKHSGRYEIDDLLIVVEVNFSEIENDNEITFYWEHNAC